MKKVERDNLLRKIEEWEIKAQNENDPFNKHLSIFIAYNIFYNLYKKSDYPDADLSRGDSKRAIATLALMKKDELFNTLKLDINRYLGIIPAYREEYWDHVKISEALLEAYERQDTRQSLGLLLKMLYKVRCNLVLGEKNYDDKLQKSLLPMSSLLMEKIMQPHTA